MMRIITGKAKGIRLKTLEGDATRPTSERVKEAVFSMIQFDVEGRSVLDLFAGSGQLGLESLSRGAMEATFVDKSKDAVAIIKENIQKTRFLDQSEVYQSDSINFLSRCGSKKFDIVFLDPPYALKLYNPALKAMLDKNILKPTSIIICESGTDAIFDGDTALEARFIVDKKTQYSKTVITILRPNFNEADNG